MERAISGGRKMKEVNYEDWVNNPTPRMMWVWNNNVEEKKKEKVIAILGQKNIKHRVLDVQGDYEYIKRFNHCAEIKELKMRRMTNQEFAWWLIDNNRREYKRSRGASVSHEFAYLEAQADKEVRDILIRENGGEWHEPLVEAE